MKETIYYSRTFPVNALKSNNGQFIKVVIKVKNNNFKRFTKDGFDIGLESDRPLL